MKRIISKDNAAYKRLKKLAGSPRARREAGRALLDGAHLAASCLQQGLRPEQWIIADGALGHAEIVALLERARDVPQTVLPDALFATLAPVDTPVGLLAEIRIAPRPAPAAPDCAVLLEDIQDPGNLGAILRTAAAAGAQVAWLSPGCADAWSPRALRAGMGAHFVLPIVEQADLLHIAAGFQGTTLAACLDGTPLFSLDLHGPVAWLLGNEGAGLSPALRDVAATRFTIPMPGAVESLNVAAAAAVCLFERVRQISLR